MRKENTIYGGEMSAHHYFCDFAYCDSCMIPWLLSSQVMTFSELVGVRMAAYPCSGEINCRVNDAKSLPRAVLDH